MKTDSVKYHNAQLRLPAIAPAPADVPEQRSIRQFRVRVADEEQFGRIFNHNRGSDT